MYRFPEGLYADIRIETTDDAHYQLQNGEVKQNSETSVTGAIIRVYDGNMWYTSITNDTDSIQQELDSLAEIAGKNADIENDPMVKLFEVHKDKVLRFEGEKDLRKTTRKMREELVQGYVDACIDKNDEDMKQWYGGYTQTHFVKQFFSSKGAEIVQDYQTCAIWIWYDFVIDGIKYDGGKMIQGFCFDDLKGHESEVTDKRDRVIDYAKNAVDVEPGDYVCVLHPNVTSMFTHESFGHKSEADHMLTDKTLQDEWVMGKKVGSELVSIYDSGTMEHRGYIAYDDEGTKPRETYLIKDGVLSGRLHDANSAAVLGEELTGNSRAQDFGYSPIVRMTNTVMAAGESDPEDIIAGVSDGIYVYDVSYGTGSSTFTMKPTICYRIRDGRIAEPLRVNVVTGSVFETLFNIDAVGNDLKFTETGWCGKGGQRMAVSMAGPTIRVRKLNIN
ncbi:TldD/PmbA family protein [Ruminococcus sp. NK3A76]|uniref:TldD/PmbA family protein n=1 Tax=Ruminococcus sp. NK3A76 TaxID=877411 RepID=UPI00048A6A59|nr:TldD/PmbA family protein [Ruminococcus sp. NK3A76]